MSDMDAAKDKLEGKFHEVKGAATGDTGEELKGKMQGTKGDVEHAAEDVHRESVRSEGRDAARDEVHRTQP